MNSTARFAHLSVPRSLKNQRTRIFVPGSDPLFNPARRHSPRDWMHVGKDEAKDPMPLWTPGFLDRLQPQVTRHHE